MVNRQEGDNRGLMRPLSSDGLTRREVPTARPSEPVKNRWSGYTPNEPDETEYSSPAPSYPAQAYPVAPSYPIKQQAAPFPPAQQYPPQADMMQPPAPNPYPMQQQEASFIPAQSYPTPQSAPVQQVPVQGLSDAARPRRSRLREHAQVEGLEQQATVYLQQETPYPQQDMPYPQQPQAGMLPVAQQGYTQQTPAFYPPRPMQAGMPPVAQSRQGYAQQAPVGYPPRPMQAGMPPMAQQRPFAQQPPVNDPPQPIKAQAQAQAARQNSYPVPASGAMRAPKQLSAAARPMEDEWAEEEQEDAVPNEKMASPVTVPTVGATEAQKKRRSGLLVALAAIVLAGAVGYFWFAVLPGILPPDATPVPDAVPSVFAVVNTPSADELLSEQPLPTATLTPARASNAPSVLSFIAEQSSQTVPATVTFTLQTVGEVTDVRLLNDNGVLLSTEGQSSPMGDGQQWVFVVEFEKAYQGNAHAYLRNTQGGWTDAGVTCEVSVQ